MRRITSILVVATTVWLNAGLANAELNSPKIGWQADLSRLAHNVSGSVTIVDEDTVRVDNFTYDGGGLDVYFYLGQAETKQAFTDGLQIGPQLLGSNFTGNSPPLVIDLPAGQTLEGWNAISVWCVTVSVNFGSGTFAPVTQPVPGDYNGNGAVDAADYVVWRNTLGQSGSGLAADGNGNQMIDSGDYNFWRAGFGQTNGSGGGLTAAVPEPAAWLVVCGCATLSLCIRTHRGRSTRNESRWNRAASIRGR